MVSNFQTSLKGKQKDQHTLSLHPIVLLNNLYGVNPRHAPTALSPVAMSFLIPQSQNGNKPSTPTVATTPSSRSPSAMVTRSFRTVEVRKLPGTRVDFNNHDDKIQTQPLMSISSSNWGMKQISTWDITHLHVGDDFVCLVLPMPNNRELKAAGNARVSVPHSFKRGWERTN